MSSQAHPPRKAPTVGAYVLLAVGFWLAEACFLANSGVLARLPIPVPALVAVVAAIVLGLIWAVPSLKAWVMALDLRFLVAIHLTRFVGFWFLVLYGRGELPWAFAVPGGWGDVMVAGLATLVLVAFMPIRTGAGRAAVFAWNVIGSLDILFVVVTAARLVMSAPESMATLTRLPMSLLPTFLVPLIVVSHVLIFVRLRRPAAE